MANDTFVGRPVNGDISHYSEHRVVEQWDAEKFVELLDAVLDLPGVKAVRWNQYTPYFNDGEACVFSANDIRIQTEDTDEDAGDYEDGFEEVYELQPDGEYVGNWPDRKFVVKDENDPKFPLYDAANSLNQGIAGGHFDNLVLPTFGDPAEVTATKEGFDVEFYEHD